ncbi:MAG: S8 family serine peptidase [Saprospiraceae bacterium]
MTQKLLLLLLATAWWLPGFSQQPVRVKWWLEFSDKNNSPYCTCRPAEFLSARALERRSRAGIAVVENDLPVNPHYLHALRSQSADIHNTSRWLNAATVVADSVTARVLGQLPFVKKIQYVGPDIPVRNPPNRPPKERVPLAERPSAQGETAGMGYASLQNSLLGVPLLHAVGYRGDGIWVAVMDGGFTNTDTLAFFDSVAVQGRLFEGWDFVERDRAVFESAMHGTSVLSVMAANLPGFFIGAAPEATYFLLKTEDTGGEFPVEETNWIAGAEWADSIGVDILNASLGYTVFNDTTLGHWRAVLDGRTAIGSRGAAIAATKGMIVCNSAGNSGDEPWTYVGVPADASGVIGVGAVEHSGERASFSSQGPTADGRIKPDLMAPGATVVVAGATGAELDVSQGTSLASPMLVGSLASLWSAFPEKTAQEILDAVFVSADQVNDPDTLRGYGLPDMARSWLALGRFLNKNAFNNARNGFFSYDRSAGELAVLLFENPEKSQTRMELTNCLGEPVAIGRAEWRTHTLTVITFENMRDTKPGFYQLVLRDGVGEWRLAVLLWP